MTTKYNEIESLAGLIEDIKTDGWCENLVNNISHSVDRITVATPFDAHLHLRDGDMLKQVAPLSAETFSGAIIMPNLIPAIETVEAALEYRQRIQTVVEEGSELGEARFEPYMTLNFTTKYTREELELAKQNGLIGIKMYPKGQTTNSEGGINGSEIDSYREILEMMQDLGIPLLVHGERIDGGDKIDELDKERTFKTIYEHLAMFFPKLKIVMEHVSTKEIIELVNEYDNLYATVTLHHLLMIHNHIVGGGTKTHIMCMPIPKLWDDRFFLLKSVLSGNPKIMFGSDSAPHPQNKKESACGCAGVFTAPIALQALVEIFDSFGQLDRLDAFVSKNAQEIYGITLPEKHINIERKSFRVPEVYGSGENRVVPFLDGRKLAWSMKSITFTK